MTANQIAYWNLQESKRSNIRRETESERSNRARERETFRSNVAHEHENRRHNLMTEKVADQQVDVARRNLSVNAALGAGNLLLNTIKTFKGSTTEGISVLGGLLR